MVYMSCALHSEDLSYASHMACVYGAFQRIIGKAHCNLGKDSQRKLIGVGSDLIMDVQSVLVNSKTQGTLESLLQPLRR